MTIERSFYYVFMLALRVGQGVSYVRRKLGLPYWSLSAWAKQRVKTAVNFIGSFETCLAEEARRSGVEGVICGHIHHAAERDLDGIRYLNTGDWVESCTALIEHVDGRMEILRYADVIAASRASAEVRPPLALAS